MVERYSHQNGSHIQAAMDKLEHRYQFNKTFKDNHLEYSYLMSSIQSNDALRSVVFNAFTKA